MVSNYKFILRCLILTTKLNNRLNEHIKIDSTIVKLQQGGPPPTIETGEFYET